MIRRPPRSTLSSSSAASDVYKRQVSTQSTGICVPAMLFGRTARALHRVACRGWKPSKIAPCRAFCTADAPPPPMKREEHELSQVIPGSKTPGPKMVLGYTCTVCETRSFRTISRASYDNGVVLVRCEGLSLIHISEPTRLLSISYAVFCLKKKKKKSQTNICNYGNQDIEISSDDTVLLF
eukprot:TRINITY_DN22441_c0_g1_i1.p1 TRINITY_DN22441_c0_g1~~TRINITY_DN22441_c0_g1_i1.p1  ORF type:complete len:181 (+),score=37.48 TRINITY_DN22441_c0_g1_i1:154-696(+)